MYFTSVYILFKVLTKNVGDMCKWMKAPTEKKEGIRFPSCWSYRLLWTSLHIWKRTTVLFKCSTHFQHWALSPSWNLRMPEPWSIQQVATIQQVTHQTNNSLMESPAWKIPVGTMTENDQLLLSVVFLKFHYICVNHRYGCFPTAYVCIIMKIFHLLGTHITVSDQEYDSCLICIILMDRIFLITNIGK